MGQVLQRTLSGSAGTALSTAYSAIVTDATDGGSPVLDGNGYGTVGTNPGPTRVHDTGGQITRSGGAVSGTAILGTGCDLAVVLQSVGSGDYYFVDFSATGCSLYQGPGTNLSGDIAYSSLAAASQPNIPTDASFPYSLNLTGSTLVLTLGSATQPTYTFTDSTLAGPFYVGFRNGGGATGGQSSSGARKFGTYTLSDPAASSALAAGTLAADAPTASSVNLTLSGTAGGTPPYAIQFQQAPDSGGSPGTWANLGAAGTATTYAVSGLTAGTPYHFRAVAADSAGTPATATSNVVDATTAAAPTPSFALTLAPATIPLAQGGTATTTVTVAPAGGFAGTVTLGTGGLPAGVAAAFNPTTVAGNGNAALTLTATGSAQLGPTPITVTGQSGSLNASVAGTLAVAAAPPAAGSGGLTAQQVQDACLAAISTLIPHPIPFNATGQVQVDLVALNGTVTPAANLATTYATTPSDASLAAVGGKLGVAAATTAAAAAQTAATTAATAAGAAQTAATAASTAATAAGAAIGTLATSVAAGVALKAGTMAPATFLNNVLVDTGISLPQAVTVLFADAAGTITGPGATVAGGPTGTVQVKLPSGTPVINAQMNLGQRVSTTVLSVPAPAGGTGS